MIDTLTSAPGRIVSGALPFVAVGETTVHSVGQQLTSVGGALLASVIIHLGLSLVNYCKTKLFKPNDNQIIINSQKTTVNQKSSDLPPAAVDNGNVITAPTAE